MQGTLFIISAPSGAGKTTVATQALERLQKKYDISRVITFTSRRSRGEETNLSDYHFISKEEFEQKIKDGFFIEYTEYAGNYYGSPISILDDMKLGKSFFSIIDIEGAKAVKKVVPEAVLVWIKPPSMEELARRLKERGTESDTQIQKRLVVAEQELEEVDKHQRLFDYLITNDVFEESVEGLMKIVEKKLG